MQILGLVSLQDQRRQIGRYIHTYIAIIIKGMCVCVHIYICMYIYGLPWCLSGKESTCQCRRRRFDSWVGKIPWRRKWQPTPVLLLGKSHGQRSWWAAVHGVTKSQTQLNTHSEISKLQPSGPINLSVFVNKVLLDHRHVHLLTYYP